jgi:large subunit ribosomal protein L17
MRHLKHRHKLGVKTPHRAALLANLTASLILHKRIKTTLSKAKALRPFAEQVITLAKKAHLAEEPERKLHYRRQAISKVRDQEAVAILFSERVEEFLDRPGGYTRIYKLIPRKGDGADIAIIEMIDADDEGYTKPKKGRKRSRRSTKKEAVDEEAAVDEVEEPTETVAEASTEEVAESEAPEQPEASSEEPEAEKK